MCFFEGVKVNFDLSYISLLNSINRTWVREKLPLGESIILWSEIGLVTPRVFINSQ